MVWCLEAVVHVRQIFHHNWRSFQKVYICWSDGRSGSSLFERAQGCVSLGKRVWISPSSFLGLRRGDCNDVLNAGDEGHVLRYFEAQHRAQREESAVAPHVVCSWLLWYSIWNSAVFSWTFCINVPQQGILHIGHRFCTLWCTLLPSAFLQRPRMCVICDHFAGIVRHPVCLLLHSHDFLDSVSASVSLPLPLLAHSLEAAEDGAAATPRQRVEGYISHLRCRRWGRRRDGGGQRESRGGWGCGAALLAGQGDTLIHRGHSQVVILDMQVGTYL